MSAPTRTKSEVDVFRVHAPPDAFTRVYHEIIDDRSLTPNAKLLITHMLDQARKGEVYDIDRETISYWLGSGTPKGYAGRTKVDAAISNAKDCGFILSEQVNSPAHGRFITYWWVTEVRGKFNTAQMPLPFQGEDDPPPEVSKHPMSGFPTTGEPTAGQPTAGEPTADKPAADAAHHGLMVNGLMVNGAERSKERNGGERGRRYSHRPKRNAVGGPCLSDLSECQAFITHGVRDGDPVRLDVPEIDMQKLFALFRSERARGSLEDVTTQRFVAAAVRAKNVVGRDGGNLLALFASIVNKRGANPQAPTKHWVVISDDDWTETEQLLARHKSSQENWTATQAVRSVAADKGLDPFLVARKKWPNISRDEWNQMDRLYPAT